MENRDQEIEELKNQNKILQEQEFQAMRERFRRTFLTTAALGLGVSLLADK